MRRYGLVVRLWLLVLVCLSLGASSAPLRLAATPAPAVVPAGFTDALLANIPSPVALAFTPDGRLLIASQPGKLLVYHNDTLRAPPAIDLAPTLCANSERGLLGVAVDPAFATNQYVYLFYTFNKHGGCERNTPRAPVNRVARFTLGANHLIDPASERVLIDNIPSPNGNHNAGDLQFGKDGLLYISVGDGGCDYADSSRCAGANDAARDQHVLLGKILRITRDGAIPSTNPFQGSDSARCQLTGRTDPGKKCQETFAWGLRNPFRIAFDPNASTTRFFINDVGQNAWEEINLGAAGADYGWNVREGPCVNGSTTTCGAPPAGMTNPIHAYTHTNGCESITGGAFVPRGVWPAAYEGAYVVGDYVCGALLTIRPASGGGYTQSEFLSGLGVNSAVTLLFGPYGSTQALYYTTYGGSYAGGSGQLRRVSYSGTANRAPTAVLGAAPTAGAAPLAVSFSGSGSRDPDPGDTLTYRWSFGDGSATVETTSATISHTYRTVGTSTATLVVRDQHGAPSAAAAVRIDVGNTPPVPRITAPDPRLRFAVGQPITLQGSATDAQDGTVPASALSWRVILYHGTHTHPFVGPTSGSSVTFTAPGPEDLAATTTSYLELELTATDSHGRTGVVRQALRPRQVDVTFATEPSGLRLGVNDTTVTAARAITSWDGYRLQVRAPDQADGTGQPWVFRSWSDGGAAAHTITTPGSPTTYTATFVAENGGTGLHATYFDNLNFTGAQVTRIDPTVNYSWGTGAPAPGIEADSFSVRWVGQVLPQYGETYTFSTTSDDGVRLWVNGKQLVDNWTNHAPTENSGTITLEAGKLYPIVMEFYDDVDGAVAKLAWSSPRQAKQIIPQRRLYPEVVRKLYLPNVFASRFAGSGLAVEGDALERIGLR